MSQTAPKGPPGLKSFAVLFRHPKECFLTKEQFHKAIYLELRFAKSFLVERNGVKMIRTVLQHHTGARTTALMTDYSGDDNALQLALEQVIDDTYEEHRARLIQRLTS